MDKIIKKVLNTITKAGFEAYLVGGFVRDYLLGIKSLDVDICTNALPKDLHQLFPSSNNSNDYGGFNLKIKNFNIDITTYRKELKYNQRKPIEIVYINNLEEDIKRRDFTINSVCMDENEKVIDLVDGIQDIRNHTIRMLGNIEERLEEDPLRILRAIRFASILNFKIEDNLLKALKKKSYLVKTLSLIRVKQELTKILLNKNYLIGLKLLKDLNILDNLEISYDEINYVNDICGMWAQLNVNKNYGFTKQEIRNIIIIRQIVNAGVINEKTLYNYGLYNSLVAADILLIDKKKINKMYAKLPIKSAKDLQLSSEEILQIMDIKPSPQLKAIKKELIDLILEGKLSNNKDTLTKYLLNKK